MNWQETLVIAALRSCALVVLAGAALAALRERRADVKLAVWTGVLAASLAMPALPGLLPEFVISRPAAQPVVEAPTRQVSSVAAAAALVKLPAQPPATPTALWTWRDLATALYIAVGVLLSMRLVLGLIHVSRLTGRARPVPELGDDVLESDELKLPAAAGILRPVVLLPSNWREWTADTLDSVLAHERSHSARWDFAVQALTRLHRALFWFSPLSWWLTRHIAALAEQASDDAALQTVNTDRARYAEILLAFGSPEIRGAADANLVAMAHWRTLTARVERILDEQFLPGPPLSTARKAVVAGAMCASACLIAAVTVKAQQPPPAPSPMQPAPGSAQTPKPSPLPDAPEAEPLAGAHDSEDSWIIFLGNGRTMMSGSTRDLERARDRRTSGRDSIWVRRDGKEYVIDDESLVKRAREIQSDLATSPELAAQLEAHGKRLEEHHRAMEAQVRQQQRIRKPDLDRHVKGLEAEVQRLKALKLPAEISQDELGELHSRIGEIHSRLGELEETLGGLEHGLDGQHEAVIAGQSAAMEAMTAKFESEQARWEMEHERRAAAAEKRLRSLIDEAIRSGKARRAGDF